MMFSFPGQNISALLVLPGRIDSCSVCANRLGVSKMEFNGFPARNNKTYDGIVFLREDTYRDSG